MSIRLKSSTDDVSAPPELDTAPTLWEPVIGLEVHIQLSTQSKLFSGSINAYGGDPNTQACIIDLALPGSLPVLNAEAVTMAVKFGLSVDANIPNYSLFSRKNYFYPDLPKGYQISQSEHPIVRNGHLAFVLENGEYKSVRIERAHLEEDAGKSLHAQTDNLSCIDLNRAGVPLLEIVSAPELASAKEAVAYLKTLHTLVRYLDICDGNLQEGSFRCDANVSVRQRRQKQLGTRVEIKNLNSFRFIERAIQYEIDRQIQVLTDGKYIKQETRLYDSEEQETRPMRTKGNEEDYRYFPDPDLRPVVLTKEWIERIRKTLPELPATKKQRFQKDYGLSDYDAGLLVSSRELGDYFEEVVGQNIPVKLAANWIMGELSAALNKENLSITQSPLSAQRLATLLRRIADNTISNNIAKGILEALWTTHKTVDQLIQEQNLQQITDPVVITQLIDDVLAANPLQVAEYRAGKDKLYGFFIGQIMKVSSGKLNPQQLNDILKQRLGTPNPHGA